MNGIQEVARSIRVSSTNKIKGSVERVLDAARRWPEKLDSFGLLRDLNTAQHHHHCCRLGSRTIWQSAQFTLAVC